MFRANSPYSPFFTSGLLSQPISAIPKDDSISTAEDQSAIYFDVVFSDDDEYRSFLSLDLAETQSMRSLSIKRKSSRNTRKPRASPITDTPSLRSQPSPKPVPSITLPSPPSRLSKPLLSTSPPRLPSLLPLPPLNLHILPNLKSTTHPRKHSVASSTKPSTTAPTRQSSTVSSNTRLRNRATALALLEGRQKPVVPTPPRHPRQLKNFMSMSDDEDEDEDEDEDILPRSDTEDDPLQLQSFNPTFEPEDIVLPASPTTLSFPPSRLPRPSNSAKLGGRKASQRRVKPKLGKPTEWFPLKSFIDLYNDNDDESRSSNGWNWRSFIEVSNVS